MIVILGPTATGKTQLAAYIASKMGGEIISADSRQVYQGMDIGTGKDLEDYVVDGIKIPFHLIDLHPPGYEYNVFAYQKDFIEAFHDIIKREKMPILCGGSGMYLESVLNGYRLIKVAENEDLRKSLDNLSIKQLQKKLKSYGLLHNMTDLLDKNRLIKAIEIKEYYANNSEEEVDFPEINAKVFGIHFERKLLRERITYRLQQRLQNGMVEEVERLLQQGITAEQLKFYGLEYKFLTQYIVKEITFDEMFGLLNTAIHQFAKRQMTWFRRMEKRGTDIHWLEGMSTKEEKWKKVYSEL